MLTAKTEKKEDKFRTALEYLIEYQGVKGAIIFDREGLVIGHLSRDDANPELFSPLALLILDQTSQILSRLGEAAVYSMVLKNRESWITIERVDNLVLVVRAGNNTDELLRVRIGQAADMVKSYVKDKYPLLAR